MSLALWRERAGVDDRDLQCRSLSSIEWRGATRPSVASLHGIAAMEDDGDRARQDAKVRREGPVPGVGAVEVQALFPADRTTP